MTDLKAKQGTIEIEYIKGSSILEERLKQYRKPIQKNEEPAEREEKPYTIFDLIKDFTDYISRQSGMIQIGIKVPVSGYDSPEIADKFNGQKNKAYNSNNNSCNNRNNSHNNSSLDKLLEGDHTETQEGYRRTEYQSLQKGLERDTAKYFGKIGDGIGEGGIIFVDDKDEITEQYGSQNDIAGAKILMDRYMKFINKTEIGIELGKRVLQENKGSENRIDGYAFVEMGEGVRAAVIKYTVNGERRNILGINKKCAQEIFSRGEDGLTSQEIDWYGHEFGHMQGLDDDKHGITAEENNDGRLKEIYSGIARNPNISSRTRDLAGYLSPAAQHRLDSLPEIYSGGYKNN